METVQESPPQDIWWNIPNNNKKVLGIFLWKLRISQECNASNSNRSFLIDDESILLLLMAHHGGPNDNLNS